MRTFLLIVLALSSLNSYAVKSHGKAPSAENENTYGYGKRDLNDGLPIMINNDDDLFKVLINNPDAQSLKIAEAYINDNWLKRAGLLDKKTNITLSKYNLSQPVGTYGISIKSANGLDSFSTPVSDLSNDGIKSLKRSVMGIASRQQ